MLKPLSKKLKILQNAGKAGWKPFQTLSCLECIVSISNRRTLQGSSSLTFISRWGLCFLVWRMTWQEDIQLIKTLNSNSLCASKLTPRYDTKVIGNLASDWDVSWNHCISVAMMPPAFQITFFYFFKIIIFWFFM
jgi:hypothetical protein